MAPRKFMVGIDLNLNELLNGVIQKLATDPVSLVEAQIWYNTAQKQLKIYDGVEVKTLAVGGDLVSAVTRAQASLAAGTLMVSAGADRSAKDYDGGAGIIKSDANGVISAATEGTDYVTASSINTLTNKTFDANATGNAISNIEVADLAASALAVSIGGGSSSTLATTDVIKTYVDNAVSSMGQLVGAHDASLGALPTTGSGIGDAIVAGDYWRVSVSGDIAGLGHLEIGDALVASVDNAALAADFFVLQANLTDAVTSDGLASVNNAIARFDGTTGRVIKNSGASVTNDGSVNVPAGEGFLVDGVQHKHAFADLTDVQESNVDLETLVATVDSASQRAVIAFDDTTDWVNASAPYTITIDAASHGLSADNSIVAVVRDSAGAVVETGLSIAANGTVVITSNTKFAGSVAIHG